MEKLLKSNKTLNELIELADLHFKNNQSEFKNDYEGSFRNDSEDVLLFWFGSCNDIFSLIQSLISSYTAIKSGNKIHLFSTKNNKYNSTIVNFLENSGIENLNTQFKFTLIDLEDFESLKAYKRAKKFGEKSYFPHFNFWCIKHLEYERINIFHNDTLFYGKINFSKDDHIVCWVSGYSKKRHKKNKMLNKIKSNFEIDKKEFLTNHIHTGILSINSNVKNLWNNFMEDNSEWISKNWNIFMYHEQELLAILKQIENLNLRHSNESKVWAYSNESFFLHYDENYKHTLYLDDDVIENKRPHNSKSRSWDYNSLNLFRENVNEIIKILLSITKRAD